MLPRNPIRFLLRMCTVRTRLSGFRIRGTFRHSLPPRAPCRTFCSGRLSLPELCAQAITKQCSATPIILSGAAGTWQNADAIACDAAAQCLTRRRLGGRSRTDTMTCTIHAGRAELILITWKEWSLKSAASADTLAAECAAPKEINWLARQNDACLQYSAQWRWIRFILRQR